MASAQLREVRHSTSPETLVIVVPGVGTASPRTWFEGKGESWLDFLPSSALPSPAVYQYNHGLNSGEKDSQIWHNVLEKGLGLLEALLMLLGNKEKVSPTLLPDDFELTKPFQSCPIVFIAHSLGGIIVKQVIFFELVVKAMDADSCSASPRHSKGQRTSRTSYQRRIPNQLNQKIGTSRKLLAGTHGYRKRGYPASVKDATRLADLRLRFEGVATNLHIITFCETEETPIKSLFVRASKASKTVIVPKELCKVNARLEEFVEVTANHLDICEVMPWPLLEEHVRRAVSTATFRIKTVLSEDHTAANQLRNESEHLGLKSTSNQATAAFSETRRDGMAHLPDFSTARRDPRLPCHIIPNAKNRDFYGRSDVLARIDDCLTPFDDNKESKKDVKTFALCGPGGMGKTEVANEFAITHTEVYEAIFWVYAKEATTLADEFSQIAENLGLVLEGTADARDPVVTRELVKGWLEKPVRSYNKTNTDPEDEVSWLLIFDNVENPDVIEEFWPPTGSNGSVLITSRDPLAMTPYYQIQDGIDLPPLSKEDAADLLLKLTWREQDAEEQKLSLPVAEKLEGIPLALIQIAGVIIRQTRGTLSNFLSLSLEPSHIKRKNYGYTVWALEELKHSSGLLDVMAFLGADKISERYLTEIIGTAQLPDYSQSLAEYQDARSELLTSSLIKNDRSASNLTIHRLIQDTERAKMIPDRSTRVFSAVVNLLKTMWPAAELGVRHHVARWKDCEPLSPHILQLKEHFDRAGESLKSRWKKNFEFANLLNELGWYFQERGYTPEAMECYRISQENIEHIIDDGSHQRARATHQMKREDKEMALLAEIHNNIAGAATEYNDPDMAKSHFLTYNKMLKDEHGGLNTVEDSRLTSSFFNVGMSFMMKGEYESFIVWLNQALTEAERLLDIRKVKSARSLALIKLGLAYWLMNRPEEASERLETARKEREELFGPNDRQSMITGRVLYGLGNVRHSQGLLDDSLDYHQRALLHFKETVGNNHHRTGNSCFKVSEHYLRIGNLTEAIELLDQAIKIFDRHHCYLGERGRSYFLKSAVLEQQGQDEISQSCLQAARTLYNTLNGDVSGADLKLQDFDIHVHVWGR
ncbi:hypothetical protein N7519_007706 [Penicillium mononematosum]|uniref:uncharacterized protein n=1 Tax=Penicillium mononematosum TaxID=268346 RepID=UPI0025495D2D|nr:uncharacterized protein N7519_007706 [Penicillium mononematosum]KAJ6186405.1 hypothetical protein N7519_007706 [Penicillium mononematosum]